MAYYFKHPTFNLKHKIRNNYYIQLQEIYTDTKTALQKPTQPRSLPISIGRGIGE